MLNGRHFADLPQRAFERGATCITMSVRTNRWVASKCTVGKAAERFGRRSPECLD
jgi:hypothetical protein